MKEIKNMLLGIAIMLAVIVFHLYMTNTGLITDFIAIIGIILVIKGYCFKGKTEKENHDKKE